MPDVIGFVIGLLVLSGIGVGPALWLLAPGGRRVPLALSISAALGLVIVGLLQRLFVVWIGPVRVWAGPLTIILLAVSVVAVINHWRRRRDEFSFFKNWRGLLPLAAILLASGAALVAPLLVKGIEYTIFRSNSSDALVYMSLAESLRTVGWQTLLRGAPFTLANLPNLTALAAISPTALFTARFVMPTSVLNYPETIAWGAQITGLPVYRYYYLMALACFAAALPLGWVIGYQLRLPRLVWYLAGPAIALGFWARFVLERDAGYQISSIPALLLAIFAWIQLENEPLRLISPARVLLALSITALLYFHTPVILVIVAAMAVYYPLGLILRQVPLRAAVYQAATAALVSIILGLTGQLRAVIVTSIGVTSVVQQLVSIQAEVVDILRQDPIAAFWGLPRPWLIWPLPGAWQVVLRRLALLSGLAWFAALVLTAVAAVLKRASKAELVVLSTAAGGLGVSAVLLRLDNLRAADKGFTYIYPYLILAAACALLHLPSIGRLPLRPAASMVMGGLLLSQAVLGAYLPFYTQARGLFAVSATVKSEDYDLSPILAYLAKHPPRLLLVNIPREKSWEFALYSMFVFERYPAHFQSGLVVDNNLLYQSLWLDTLQATPDYAVMLKSADTVGLANLGTRVAETGDLVLYQLKGANLEWFQAQESQARTREQAKPVFPTLAQ